ncbi:hypothetical protein AMATHDRAFT_61336 [Amanita thiersii Skay4041]|uniref:RING-type domain-containing protein n=1 Tax=Amanita thiersii Skay4041 TaxID=703135 RepID=A0A2A9NJN6_9AGAR|nr:hypothetical protein AMATHDRAFT_61336 [Amanita thiersii Skay4041]
MSGNCPICLSALKEPVSIPCGHVYCTKCLADHVNSSNDSEEVTATCPTCRSEFYIVTPELTYLPKKFHQYVLPAVRRIYIDTSVILSLDKKLTKAEARFEKLKKNEEILMQRCEKHIIAANALALREQEALMEVDRLKNQINTLTKRTQNINEDYDWLISAVDQAQADSFMWKSKYNKLKQKMHDLESQQPNGVRQEVPDKSVMVSKRKSKNPPKSAPSHDDQSTYEQVQTSLATTDSSMTVDTPVVTRERKVRPIPRKSPRAISTQCQPNEIERAKRQRVATIRMRSGSPSPPDGYLS